MDYEDVFMQYIPAREFVIGLEFIVGGFFFFYIFQFIRGTLQRKKNKEKIEMQLSWAFFFVGQALLNGIKVYADFYQPYIPELLDRLYLNNIAIVAGMLGLMAVSIVIEGILKSGYINTIVISFISICVVFVYYFPSNYLTIFMFVAYFSTLGMIYALVYTRVVDNPNLMKILKIFVLGFGLLFTGNLLKSDVILVPIHEFFVARSGYDNSVFIMRIFGDFFVIASTFILQLSFQEFPSFMELNWKQHVFEIHIVSNNGIELFTYSFKNRDIETSINPDLMAAAMSGVNDIIKEVTGSSENLNLIDQGDTKLMFEKSPQCVIFLLADQPLEIYRFKLQKLMVEIVEIYGTFMENWTGDVSAFEDAGEIIQKVF